MFHLNGYSQVRSTGCIFPREGGVLPVLWSCGESTRSLPQLIETNFFFSSLGAPSLNHYNWSLWNFTQLKKSWTAAVAFNFYPVFRLCRRHSNLFLS
jgi:hypothetical protein